MKTLTLLALMALTCGYAYGDTGDEDSPAQSEGSPCSEPAPLGCWKQGRLRLDPVIVMPTGRYTWTSVAGPNEINPFKAGLLELDLQMAGIDVSSVWLDDKVWIGANMGFGITNYEDAGLMVWSWSAFFQVSNVYRIEAGLMKAESGRVEELMAGMATAPASAGSTAMLNGGDSPNDKWATFVGVSFPVVSNGVRRLLGKLAN